MSPEYASVILAPGWSSVIFAWNGLVCYQETLFAERLQCAVLSLSRFKPQELLECL